VKVVAKDSSVFEGLLSRTDGRRRDAIPKLSASTKGDLGQFMTPAPIAEFMASLFPVSPLAEIRLLDPGAGVGSLLAAFVARVCRRPSKVRRISIAAYEIDGNLCRLLRETLADCRASAAEREVAVDWEVRSVDFVSEGAGLIDGNLFESGESFTHVITNPPYRKVATDSAHRLALRRVGIEVTNLYSAFVALAVRLLEPRGELVAITPRSFCNGPYFQPFRNLLLSRCSLRRVHLFQSRDAAFRDDSVLQENIIYAGSRSPQHATVRISSSFGPSFSRTVSRMVPFSQVVRPDDPNVVIHLPASTEDDEAVRGLQCLSHAIQDLGIEVSTGPVVDFRLRGYLRSDPAPMTAPLLYPAHFRGGELRWPKLDGRKPNAIDVTPETRKWLMPIGYYTVTRRFSSKEEKRRIVASVLDPRDLDTELVGFENHLNVFHQNGRGLDPLLARGLSGFLNSTIVDRLFRVFNGHTQVNASDLRSLRYPSVRDLKTLGSRLTGVRLSQEELDDLVTAVLLRGQTAA